ncbi:mannose-1-phosphate guanylyltransferase [Paenibacillus sp. LMG 31461]|uniref:Mannose-1-phosphate guanylyltransferase n=1 Tax=Paenibacillus plantarum TaxID=2654975 RepID=A0ABX1XE29_9BACL|nr:sugar phosphate nucleotidyltransferase [Paenibacillus plantarum]NOU66733.1 mannose-1-phosphate guanylyltransferase [Paenibacillus plantarum]
MKLVLLSGGSGKRLWPLSNDARSKQFLKVLSNKEGSMESMVQRVWRQIDSNGLSHDTYISTSKAQVQMLHSQLGKEVPLIVEPERRDTLPAIALACVYLFTEQGVSEDETICILPVDPYVEERFFQQMGALSNVLQESGSEISLIGVKPTYPSTKYGYILPREQMSDDSWFHVEKFVEKPTEDNAEELILRNALWNCGVFAFRLGYILDILKAQGLPLDYSELLLGFSEMPKISFDYAVVEKASRIAVLPYDGYWRDLGTWNTLTDEMKDTLVGKGRISHDSHNTHLINELDIPIVVLGISNVVIAASPDGILVSDKLASPRLKEMVSDFQQQPMYEETSWGSYRILDHSIVDGKMETLTRRIHLKQGNNLSYQFHNRRREVWTVLSGEGEFVLDQSFKQIRAGDIVDIPMGIGHALKAISDLVFMEIQMGSELLEEDIARVTWNWEEILQRTL